MRSIEIVVAFFLLFALLSVASIARADGQKHVEIPDEVDPGKNYLFYLHGAWVEQQGLDRPHPQYGRYAYNEIVQELADQGFVVVSEARPGVTQIPQYARKVAQQVRTLLEQEVPAEHITVSGHSKGGHMALFVASLLQESKLNYVVMAGCGKKGTGFGRGFDLFVKNRAAAVKGRILSLYDEEDQIAATCKEAFDRAAKVETKEVVLKTRRGHGVFYSPETNWIQEVTDWAHLK